MATEITSSNYVTILGWMVSDLHLKGNELLVYAIIHGFSQDGETQFAGGLSYLQKWTGLTKRAIITILQKLQERNIIEKEERIVNGLRFPMYKIVGGEKTSLVVKSTSQGGEKTSHKNNILSPNGDIYTIPPISPTNKFSFRSALLGLGVSEAVADEWLKVRKGKRAHNSEIAFQAVAEEIRKSGKPADYCIKVAVQNSWQGFKAEWLEDRSSRSTRSESGMERNGRQTSVDRMLDLGSKMFGAQTPSYDEQ